MSQVIASPNMGANLPLVPHYYFDTRDGLERITDDVGLDFDNLPAALDEPTRGLADLAKDALPVLPSRGSFLCRYKIMPNGTRTIMAFYVPGEIPDAHSLHIDVMDDSLRSVGPSRVALIAHHAMRQLIHQHPGIGDAFWRDTLIDAAIFREWIVNVGSREAYSRIAHLLCEIFLKLKAVGLTNGTSFEFPITQSKIGEATGLSTVHVNRSVQALRADGLIVLERGRCTISDLERLKEAAMFDPTYLHLRGEQRVAA